MSPLLPRQNYVWSDVHIETIKGTAADYDGQVACNCTILKGRVKRGPGRGRPTFRVRAHFDLEALRAYPQAVAYVTEEGLAAVQECAESLKSKPLTDEEMIAMLSPDGCKFTNIHGDSGVVVNVENGDDV